MRRLLSTTYNAIFWVSSKMFYQREEGENELVLSGADIDDNDFSKEDTVEPLEEMKNIPTQYSDAHPEENWIQQGNSFRKQRRFSQAIGCYQKAIDLNSNNKEAWNKKGIALRKKEKLEEAFKCYNKVKELDPNDFRPWVGEGIIYEKQEQWCRALECYNKALQIAPNLAIIISYKGDVYLAQRQWDMAILCYEEALTRYKNNRKILLKKAKAHIGKHEIEKAQEIYSLILSFKPEDEEVKRLIEKTNTPERESIENHPLLTPRTWLEQWIKEQGSINKPTFSNFGESNSDLEETFEQDKDEFIQNPIDSEQSEIASILSEPFNLPESSERDFMAIVDAFYDERAQTANENNYFKRGI